MKKRRIIISIFIVIGFLIIGLFGISGQVTLKAGNCEKSYRHYYIEPFILDFLSCMTMIPCGTAQEITIYNRKVDVIQCLCENIETNKEVIVDYNIKEFQLEPSNDVGLICKKGSVYVTRY